MQIGYLIMMTSNQQRGYVFNNFFRGGEEVGGWCFYFLELYEETCMAKYSMDCVLPYCTLSGMLLWTKSVPSIFIIVIAKVDVAQIKIKMNIASRHILLRKNILRR